MCQANSAGSQQSTTQDFTKYFLNTLSSHSHPNHLTPEQIRDRKYKWLKDKEILLTLSLNPKNT